MALDLLSALHASRSSHGLRHADHGRYRSHCAVKLSTLRTSLSLKQVSGPRSSKKFTRKPIVAPVDKERTLLIPLYEAERAWADSQVVLASTSSSDAAVKKPNARKSALRRLARAATHARQLFALARDSPSSVEPLTTAQALAYSLLLRGTYQFSTTSQLGQGVKTLSAAWVAFDRLAGAASTARGEAESRELQDSVEPLLRFCAYKTGQQTADLEGLARSTAAASADEVEPGFEAVLKAAEGSGGEKRAPTVLSWRGREIQIRNAELVDPVEKASKALAQLEEGDGKELSMKSWERAVLALGEAEDKAREVLDEQVGSAKEKQATPLGQAHQYLAFHLLVVRSARDLSLLRSSTSKLETRLDRLSTRLLNTGKSTKVLARKTAKKQVKVLPTAGKLLDSVVQSLEDVRELETVEEDAELYAKVEGRVELAKAERCLYLARTYCLLSRFPEAASLVQKGAIYARQARSYSSSSSGGNDDGGWEETDLELVKATLEVRAEQVDEAELELEKVGKQAANGWFALSGSSSAGTLGVGELSLGEGKEEGKSKTALKKLAMKEKKEKFYDVAYSYVGDVDLEALAVGAGRKQAPAALAVTAAVSEEEEEDEEMEVDAQEQEPKKEEKKGWFGWGRR